MMSKNEEVAEELKKISEYLSTWDPSIDTTYDKVKGTIGNINKIFDLSDEWTEIVEDVLRYQSFLGTTVHYREHFIHQFEVFKLGYVIINRNKKIKEKLEGYLNADIDDVIKCWFLTSISHDSAYIIEGTPICVEELLNKIFKGKVRCVFLFEPSRVQGFEYHKIKLIDLIAEKLKLTKEQTSELYGKISDILSDKKNHGLLSAIILLNRLITPGDESNKKIEYEAALAVALHTEDVYKELHDLIDRFLTFEDIPFAFLLMYCDNAQEWGRPSMMSLLNQSVNDKRVGVKLEDIDVKDEVKINLRYSKKINDIPKPDKYWGARDVCFFIYHLVDGSPDPFERLIFIIP